MKNLLGLFVLTLGCIGVLAQTSALQSTSRDDFENMTFGAELGKNNYLRSEPIFVKFRFSNQSGMPQTTYLPSFLSDCKLLVTFGGITRKFDLVSSVGGGVKLPGSVPPNWFLTADEVLDSSLAGKVFPEPGNYKLQFVLQSWGRGKSINSGVIEVTIGDPTGLDKEAFEFMRQHHDFFGLSSWTPDVEANLKLLVRFVEKFGRSSYGEMAISSLGNFYLARGEFVKAEAQFEKIRLSENLIMAKEANRLLADIDRKKKRKN